MQSSEVINASASGAAFENLNSSNLGSSALVGFKSFCVSSLCLLQVHILRPSSVAASPLGFPQLQWAISQHRSQGVGGAPPLAGCAQSP